jgi:hypothetical protein
MARPGVLAPSGPRPLHESSTGNASGVPGNPSTFLSATNVDSDSAEA